MQRFLLILLLSLCFIATGRAQQIPNGDLEIWTLGAGGNRAQHWLGTDDILNEKLGLPLTSNTTTLTNDKHGGNFAAKLETKTVSPFGPLPGYLILGHRLGSDAATAGGLPFTSRPAAMQLHYKLSGPNLAADSATAGVLLTRTVNGRRQIVATGSRVLPAAATYTLAAIPLQYGSALAPDSIHIVITSGAGEVLTAGTALYVDDITMTNTIAATYPNVDAASLTLYPNPAHATCVVQVPASLGMPLAPVGLYNSLGQLVRQQPLPVSAAGAQAEIDLRGLAAGLYTLRLATTAGTVVKRLAVE